MLRFRRIRIADSQLAIISAGPMLGKGVLCLVGGFLVAAATAFAEPPDGVPNIFELLPGLDVTVAPHCLHTNCIRVAVDFAAFGAPHVFIGDDDFRFVEDTGDGALRYADEESCSTVIGFRIGQSTTQHFTQNLQSEV